MPLSSCCETHSVSNVAARSRKSTFNFYWIEGCVLLIEAPYFYPSIRFIVNMLGNDIALCLKEVLKNSVLALKYQVDQMAQIWIK